MPVTEQAIDEFAAYAKSRLARRVPCPLNRVGWHGLTA